jgi:hypothetical protein
MISAFIDKFTVTDNIEVMAEYHLGNIKDQTFTVRGVNQEGMNGHAAGIKNKNGRNKKALKDQGFFV